QKIEQKFKKIGNKFYYFEHEETRNWLSALHKCQELGGHLATTRNIDEFVRLSIELHPDSRYFIDLNDELEQGQFLSITSGSRDNFLHWADGEPNNEYGRDAVIIRYSEFGKHMEHTPSYEEHHFICEAS
ncbi:hypothetical protein KR067_012733, partial [Drosophila pandora]